MKTGRKQSRWLGLVVAAALATVGMPAFAQWGPPQVAMEGTLTNLANEPVKGPVSLTLKLYPGQVGGTAVWSEVHLGVELVQGRFALRLGQTTPLDNPPVFETHPELWLGVSVDNGAEMTRVPMSAVGYAMQAKHAEVCDVLSGFATDLTCSECADSTEVSFNYAGSSKKGGPAADVECTGCVNGTDIANGSVLLEDLGDGTCQPGQVMKRKVAAGWECAADKDSLASLACNKDQVPQFDGAVWKCSGSVGVSEALVDQYVENNGYAKLAQLATVATTGSFSDLKGIPNGLADGDNDTTYSAGSGLKLSGTTFSVDQGAVESWAKGVCFDNEGELTAALDDNYVNTNEPNSVGGAMVQNASLGLEELADGGCAAGTVIRRKNAGSGWECAALPPGTTYFAGTGLVLNGNTFSADKGTIESWAQGVCYNSEPELTAVLNDNYAAASHTHPASQVTAGTFAAGTFQFTSGSTVEMNAKEVMTACPSGYSYQATNLCMTGWRIGKLFFDAQSDCMDEGAHVCTYAEFHYLWNQANINPGFMNGDWLGVVVGDDQVLCCNSTTDKTNFDGICDKNSSHDYRCCMGRGR